MDRSEIIVGIIIPLISALLGGFVTMLGVRITIKAERKKDAENKTLSVKPWIFSLFKAEKKNMDSINEIFFGDPEKGCTQGFYPYILIKNTDNGICILKRFQTKTKVYYPYHTDIVDKNSIVKINIAFEEGEDLKEFELYVSDVYGNQYVYDVDYYSKGSACLSIKEKSKEKKKNEAKK